MNLLVVLDLQAGVLGDGDVVSPCWGGEVDGLCTWEESCEEGGTDTQSPSSGDGLGDRELPMSILIAGLLDRTYSVLDQRLGVLTVRQLRSEFGEASETLDVSSVASAVKSGTSQ